jgi:dTDP-4-amino-4,6-dideoxygalactose transaminase
MANRKIALLDLQAQYQGIRAEVLSAIERVAESQQFILGDEVHQFETEMAAYCGSRFSVGCASGSDALRLALMAYGIGPGDEVLTVPYTFFATASAIHLCGAKTVFVDIDANTFNINVEKAARVLEQRPKIKAIIPVHLFGGCADMDPMLAVAKARGIPVIEDAAQSIGSEYKGRRAGALGDIGCFSFFPSKNLGAFGDAGLCTTQDEVLAERLRALRVHGSKVRYYHEYVGLNSRIDALQASVLRVKLPHLDHWTRGRQRNAELYRRYLEGSRVTCPAPDVYQTRHIYNQFVILTEQRDGLKQHLAKAGIGSEIYYPLPLHLQPCFAYLGHRSGDFPVSEDLAAKSLALPVYPELTPEDIAYVASHILAYADR